MNRLNFMRMMKAAEQIIGEASEYMPGYLNIQIGGYDYGDEERNRIEIHFGSDITYEISMTEKKEGGKDGEA